MKIYDIAGWTCWIVGALGAAGWLLSGAPAPALATALSGAGTGVLFFGLGEIVRHLEAIRSSAERANPEDKQPAKVENPAEDAPDNRTLEERSQDLKKLLDDVRSRKR